jgi:hypothetical protein
MAGQINKKKKNSSISNLLAQKQTQILQENKNMNFSFEDFCSNQKYSSSFIDWQKCGLLSKAMETFNGYSKSPPTYDTVGKFTYYGDFPQKTETLFEYPTHITPDAQWVRIHVTGPAVIVGHIVNNTFYVVFLDKTHKFWLTKKDREKFFGKKAL